MNIKKANDVFNTRMKTLCKARSEPTEINALWFMRSGCVGLPKTNDNQDLLQAAMLIISNANGDI